MVSKITFFSIGNADTTLIQTESGKDILVDYANRKDPNNSDDKRCDLPRELDKLVNSNGYEVVCFTHIDEDHIKGSSEYFHLDHAIKYQGEGRKTIKEIWVPAAAILEEGCKDEDRIIRAEARYRFKKGKNIKVFSRPKKLKDWCEKEGIDFEKRRHLIVDAGTVINTVDLVDDGVEFFAQSPFVSHIGDTKIDRNTAAITLHLTFNNLDQSKVILGSDINYKVWQDIVNVTNNKKNEERLEWDIFHISHHCSYTALAEDKGEDKTVPVEEVEWLFEDQGRDGCYIVSPSKPIPLPNTKEDEDRNPPHRQAANYYKSVVKKKSSSNSNDRFKVTMQYPSESKPKPMTFEIGDSGVVLKSVVASVASRVGARPAPRAGNKAL